MICGMKSVSKARNTGEQHSAQSPSSIGADHTGGHEHSRCNASDQELVIGAGAARIDDDTIDIEREQCADADDERDGARQGGEHAREQDGTPVAVAEVDRGEVVVHEGEEERVEGENGRERV